MDEKLIARLEAAVARLEATAARGGVGGGGGDDDVAESDPAILAYGELSAKYLGRVSEAAEKIGGKILEATKLLEEAFSVQKDLLVRIKQSQVCGLL